MKTSIVAILCAALLFLAAGCTGKPDANAPSAAQPTPAEDKPIQGDTQGTQGAQGTQGTQPNADDHVIDEPSLGLRFRLPDAWYSALYEQPCISPSSYLHGFAFDYITKDGMEALGKLFADPDGKESADRTALENAAASALVPLVAFCVENEGERDEELRARYTAEHDLGTANGTKYTLLSNPDADLSKLTEDERKTFQALIAAAPQFGTDIKLSGKPVAFSDGAVSFASKTVDGKDIDSKATFSQNKLTMINIWATWCGPCINELPELQKLAQDLPEGVKLLGICTDGEQEPELAAQILQKSGVTYDNACANPEMMAGFLSGIQAYPTTIFVDAQGNIVGEPMPGVPSGDVVEGYRKAIQDRLQLLGP